MRLISKGTCLLLVATHLLLCTLLVEADFFKIFKPKNKGGNKKEEAVINAGSAPDTEPSQEDAADSAEKLARDLNDMDEGIRSHPPRRRRVNIDALRAANKIQSDLAAEPSSRSREPQPSVDTSADDGVRFQPPPKRRIAPIPTPKEPEHVDTNPDDGVRFQPPPKRRLSPIPTSDQPAQEPKAGSREYVRKVGEDLDKVDEVIKNNQTPRRRHVNLDALRAANKVQADLAGDEQLEDPDDYQNSFQQTPDTYDDNLAPAPEDPNKRKSRLDQLNQLPGMRTNFVKTTVDGANKGRHPADKLLPMFPKKKKESKMSNLFKNVDLKSKMKKAYQATKASVNTVTEHLSAMPKYFNQATDSIQALLKLDSRGRLLALIDDVEDDIKFVRREFSTFTITATPVMEAALSYIGDKDLNSLYWNKDDELDFREDALFSLAFSYEFMKFMIAWRENMLMAHEAYKGYLERLLDVKDYSVEEEDIVNLNTIHSYLLLSSWQTFNEIAMESESKLDYLMVVEDDKPKNYESEYFRNIVLLQEYYVPTKKEFEDERLEVEKTMIQQGVVDEPVPGLEDYFDDFRNGVLVEKSITADIEVPDKLMEFMKNIAPEVQYNHLVYNKQFLKELKAAKKQQQEELAGQQ